VTSSAESSHADTSASTAGSKVPRDFLEPAFVLLAKTRKVRQALAPQAKLVCLTSLELIISVILELALKLRTEKGIEMARKTK